MRLVSRFGPPGVKRAVLSLMTRGAGIGYWKPLVANVATVFMLHRFSSSDVGPDATSVKRLREGLAFLRHHRFPLLSLRDLLSGDESRQQPLAARPLPPVVFTVDDGYADFANIAAPVFAEFDCPVTVFLTTGAVDNQTWFWWDRVVYTIEATSRNTVCLELGEAMRTWSWSRREERRAAAADIVKRLKAVPNGEKERALTTVAQRLEVDVPAVPPSRFTPMSWCDVRACASRGVTFGPHTVTHPILTQLPEAEAEWEVTESWQRLQAECSEAVPVFSYPNGLFGQREVEIVSRVGLKAAVTTKPYYVSPRAFREPLIDARFHVPRFNYPSDQVEFVSVVTGLDRVNALLREGLTGWRCVGDDRDRAAS